MTASPILSRLAQNTLLLFSSNDQQTQALTSRAAATPRFTARSEVADTTYLSPRAKTIKLIKDLAQQNDAEKSMQVDNGDKIRLLARDGKFDAIATLSDSDLALLSPEEKDLYNQIQSWKGYYDAQPQTTTDALDDYVQNVLQTYPESIARMKAGVASGELPETDGWKDVIAQYENELTAAQQGKMKIQSVSQQNLIWETGSYSLSKNAFGGWDMNTPNLQANIPALQKRCGTQNVCAGASSAFGNYVIYW